jgi:hypothetical protein
MGKLKKTPNLKGEYQIRAGKSIKHWVRGNPIQ